MCHFVNRFTVVQSSWRRWSRKARSKAEHPSLKCSSSYCMSFGWLFLQLKNPPLRGLPEVKWLCTHMHRQMTYETGIIFLLVENCFGSTSNALPKKRHAADSEKVWMLKWTNAVLDKLPSPTLSSFKILLDLVFPYSICWSMVLQQAW